MSNYTDLQEIRNHSEENNNSVNNFIDEKIYANTEQEITPDMVNEAVKSVEDDRFNNTENVVDFLEKASTKNVKIRLYDGYGVEWGDESRANIYTEPSTSILLIQVPKYTNINADGLTEDMWRHSCVLDGFIDGDDIGGIYNYAYINNWNYNDSSAGFSINKIYRTYNERFLPDTNYSWSEDAMLDYISAQDTTIVLTVRDEAVSNLYYSPGVDADNIQIMVSEEEVESLTFENNNYLDYNYDAFNRNVSDTLTSNYYFNAIGGVTRAFKTKVNYNSRNLNFDLNNNIWVNVSGNPMRIIQVYPFDTLSIKGYNFTRLGATYNIPSANQTPQFATIYPTIDNLSEDWDGESITYDGDAANYINRELTITNTTDRPIYVWFRFLSPTNPYIRINGYDIFYDVSQTGSWKIKDPIFYQGWNVLNDDDEKINMLYKELGKMHKLLYDIVKNIQQ